MGNPPDDFSGGITNGAIAGVEVATSSTLNGEGTPAALRRLPTKRGTEERVFSNIYKEREYLERHPAQHLFSWRTGHRFHLAVPENITKLCVEGEDTLRRLIH